MKIDPQVFQDAKTWLYKNPQYGICNAVFTVCSKINPPLDFYENYKPFIKFWLEPEEYFMYYWPISTEYLAIRETSLDFLTCLAETEQ